MKKIFTLVFLVFSLFAFAQKTVGTVKGNLEDAEGGARLADATVSVVNLSDSTLISFTITGPTGYFEIKNIAEGKYDLVVSYTGFRTTRKKFNITAAEPVADFGAIAMDRNYSTMEEVIIKDEAPIKIKGDTISYNADAFKTKPNANVEDLLKKLPGVQVERDGTVRAQGEQVQRVYVDGKEFFGNDPKLATRNLTADMVDQVEVFDDMSEQAKFNGMDDGSRSKAINLKLKKDKKKGIFGRAYAGAGTQERYDAGVNANFFKGATQTSLIAKSNNTNNVGFSVSDIIGMTGNSGGGFGGGGFGGGGAMNVVRGAVGGGSVGGLNLGSTGAGITSSSQLGVNYRDTWSKTFDVNGSYFYNRASTLNDRKSFRTTFAPDSVLLMDGNTKARATNDNHRINLNVIVNIDSFNSLIYTPNISFQSSSSYNLDSFHTDAQKGDSRFLTNESIADNSNVGDGYNWSNNLIWRKKFRRAGRTFSVNLSNTLGQTNRDAFSLVNARFFNNNGVKWRERITNTLNATESETRNYGINISYTEPIARDKILEILYNNTNNTSESDRRTYNYNNGSGKYDKLIDSLSNHFENTNTSHRFGSNLKFVKKKYNYQLGFSVQQTTLESNNLVKNTTIKQKFTNLFPTAVFNYQFARSRSLRFQYRGSTRAPSVTQLQEVTDISNYPYITEGNPNLKQEFSNNFTLSYNFFDIIKFRNLFAFITFNNTSNRIVNSIRQLPGGVQLSKPVNVDGYYNLLGTFNVGFPIKSLKGANLNTNTRVIVTRDVNLLDDRKNIAKNFSVGEDLRFSYNFKEKLDMGITATVNYYSASYSLQKQMNQSYYDHSYGADITYTFPKGFIFGIDLDYMINSGRSDGYNTSYALLNGSIAKELFKSKKGEIKLSVFDALNQNLNVRRNVQPNYIEDVQSSVLNRFFMLTFSYKLNRMGGRTMPAFIERATRNIRVTQ
jgi:hypothetical protein